MIGLPLTTDKCCISILVATGDTKPCGDLRIVDFACALALIMVACRFCRELPAGTKYVLIAVAAFVLAVYVYGLRLFQRYKFRNIPGDFLHRNQLQELLNLYCGYLV